MKTVLFRFKTEQEFLDEFGPEWREAVSFNYYGSMDYLLGKQVRVPIGSLDRSGNIVKGFKIKTKKYHGYWTIEGPMLTSNMRPFKVKRILHNVRVNGHHDKK